MRKRILSSVIITVMFALLIVVSVFVVFFNINKINSIKEDLKNVNNIVFDYGIENESKIKEFSGDYYINDTNVRITVMDKKGNVIFDTLKNNQDNHIDREEIQEAIKNGEGSAIRISYTMRTKNVYYATCKGNYIIRSCIQYKNISLINNDNITFFVLVFIIVILFSISLSMRLVRTIIEPVKNLEDVSRRISEGELNIRIKNTQDDEIGVLGATFNNMADQLQAKINEVIDKQNRLESILSCMESGVVAVNLDNQVFTINPYAKRIFGIRRDIEGENILDYIDNKKIVGLLNNDEDDEEEIKISKPIQRELKVKKTNIINNNVKIGKVISIQDITDLRRLENMRSQFVANVSHELKTPLTSIKGFAETLRMVDDDETRTKFLDIIDKEVDRLGRLINDTLVLSKLESDIQNEEEFLPNNIIADVIVSVEEMAKNKNTKIIEHCTNNELLLGDVDKFQQLIINLVENAIKYSEENSTVIINSYSENGEYVLSVKDNGIGIPEEDIPRIFERFYRVDKSRKGEGTGLGLAIVKHIVNLFNGKIEVKSKLGEGTEFIITINHI